VLQHRVAWGVTAQSSIGRYNTEIMRVLQHREHEGVTITQNSLGCYNTESMRVLQHRVACGVTTQSSLGCYNTERA